MRVMENRGGRLTLIRDEVQRVEESSFSASASSIIELYWTFLSVGM